MKHKLNRLIWWKSTLRLSPA